jgi:hypothetical protein
MNLETKEKIQQIETKITSIKTLIQTQKQELITYENTLQNIIQQLNTIKKKIK